MRKPSKRERVLKMKAAKRRLSFTSRTLHAGRKTKMKFRKIARENDKIIKRLLVQFLVNEACRKLKAEL